MSHENTPLDSTHLTGQAQKHTKKNIISGEECYKIIDCAFIPIYLESRPRRQA